MAGVIVSVIIVGLITPAFNGGDSNAPDRLRAAEGRQAEGAGSAEQDYPLPRAEGVAPLDMDVASRLVDGPGSSHAGGFRRSLLVQHGNVVEVATIVTNPESEDTGSVLSNVRLHFSAPTGWGKSAAITANAAADNVESREPFKQSDGVTLRSANGKPFYLSSTRSLGFQQNEPRGDNDFYWGRLVYLPKRAVTDSRNTQGTYEFTVRPSFDGTLGPGRDETVRVLFLVDVNGR